MKNITKKSKNLLIIIGGSRGLSESLSEKFSQEGFDIVAFSRHKPEFACHHICLDIFNESELNRCREEIFDIYYSCKYDSISLNFMPGGSLGYSETQLAITMQEIQKIVYFNFTAHYYICSWIIEKCINTEYQHNQGRLHFNYYFTAAQDHLRSNPLYNSSKNALLQCMKNFVRLRVKRLVFSGYKLGCVDIKHKYMHKLKQTNIKDFEALLDEEVPTNHFTSTSEVAQIVYDTHCNPNIANGMIADISGGNSWI